MNRYGGEFTDTDMDNMSNENHLISFDSNHKRLADNISTAQAFWKKDCYSDAFKEFAIDPEQQEYVESGLKELTGNAEFFENAMKDFGGYNADSDSYENFKSHSFVRESGAPEIAHERLFNKMLDNYNADPDKFNSQQDILSLINHTFNENSIIAETRNVLADNIMSEHSPFVADLDNNILSSAMSKTNPRNYNGDMDAAKLADRQAMIVAGEKFKSGGFVDNSDIENCLKYDKESYDEYKDKYSKLKNKLDWEKDPSKRVQYEKELQDLKPQYSYQNDYTEGSKVNESIRKHLSQMDNVPEAFRFLL
jgi:hypothetical protein